MRGPVDFHVRLDRRDNAPANSPWGLILVSIESTKSVPEAAAGDAWAVRLFFQLQIVPVAPALEPVRDAAQPMPQLRRRFLGRDRFVMQVRRHSSTLWRATHRLYRDPPMRSIVTPLPKRTTSQRAARYESLLRINTLMALCIDCFKVLAISTEAIPRQGYEE
jgi:hypothetical protein